MNQLNAQDHKQLDQLWKQTDSLLVKDRQPRSALEKLVKIEKLVKTQGLKDEKIKALFYRLAIESQIEDQEDHLPFSTIDSQISASKDLIETSMLQLLKVNFLVRYYQQHRYQINGRTQTSMVSASDLATWSAHDFDLTIHQLFSKVLAPAKQLQGVSTKNYGAIIHTGTVPQLRPTLFDLAIHEAIDYYKSQPFSSPASEQPYALLDSAALFPAPDFVEHQFQAPQDQDSLSAPWLALGYFQKAVRFHLKDKDPDALLDVDLERLQWCYAQLSPGRTDSAFDKAYLSALDEIMAKYPTMQTEMAAYLKATYYSDQAATYRPLEDTIHRYAYKDAIAIIDKYYSTTADNQNGTTKIKAKSEAEAGLLNLRNNILAPSSTITIEDVNIPGEPMRALVSFKNISRLYFKIVKVPVRPEGFTATQEGWTKLLQLSAFKTFEQDFPATEDYQLHRTEIKIPALPNGAYVLLASQQADFAKTDGLSATGFSVSTIAYVKYGQDLFVLDREKGTPLAGATVDFYSRTWQDKAYIYKKELRSIADKIGAVHVAATLKDKNLNLQRLMITKGADSLSAQSNFYRVYSPNNNDAEENTIDRISFFTDRSIYRPGQIVYFKGIATRTYKDGKKSTLILDKAPQHIYLFDANGQKIDSVKLSLNSYGSLSGSFQLPEGQLTGNFSLRSETLSGNQSVRVEAYKRPTFYVTLDTVSGAYQLGDSIKIVGTAMAYAGNPVGSAQVRINISRSSIFPYPWRRMGGYIPNRGQADQIAHGTVQTDAQGRFSYTFLAKGGSQQELDNMANFRFNIEAVCTDNSGETRQGKQDLIIGTQPFTIKLNVPNLTMDKLLDGINVHTKNAAGNFVQEQVTLKITQLEAPQKLIRKRLWAQPDVFVLDKTDFEKWFPLDEYKDDMNKETWPRKSEIYHQTIQTTAEGIVMLDQQMQPGWYIIEASAPGKHQKLIKDQTFVYLYQPGKPLAGAPVFQWEDTVNTYIAAGKTARLQIASAADNVYLLNALTYKKAGKTLTDFGAQKMQNHQATLAYTLKPEDIDGANLDYVFVRDNRVYTGDMQVRAKKANEPLSIKYKTFRNKTAPGTDEQWTLTIQRDGKSLKEVELLSGMYDGSLDQFQQHSWNFPDLYLNTYLSSNSWSGEESFSTNSSNSNDFGSTMYSYGFDKRYDELIFKQALEQFFPVRQALGGNTIMIRGANFSKNSVNRQAAPAANMELSDVVVGVAMNESEESTAKQPAPIPQQPLRNDFKETAFFFPQLHSDSDGNFVLNFKMPDALTTWKWMNLAYDKDLRFVTDVKSIISQKTLMVQPNLPRFLRGGDQIQLRAKISNLHTDPLTGKAELILTDPVTGKSLQNWSNTTSAAFNVPAGQSVSVDFPVSVPVDFTGPVDIVIKAAAGNFSDGEQSTLPVLSNKMMVTDALPLYMDKDGSAVFEMKKLLEQNKGSNSMQPKALTLEYNTNPIWYAITALPYLAEYPYEGAEQIFNKYYANALGAYIVDKNPVIESTFQKWMTDSSRMPASNLENNQELKSVLLQQTPWVLEAQSETARNKALAGFFKKNQLKEQMTSMLSRLEDLQMADGGFSWFNGGQSDLYITQYIASSIGRLQTMGIDKNGDQENSSALLAGIADKANAYIVNEYKRKYQDLLTLQKQKKQRLEDYRLSAADIQYLYARSFYTTKEHLNEGERFYLQQERKFWQDNSVYLQAMMAVTQYRMGDAGFAKDKIMNSVIQTAVMSPDKGMYWKTSVNGAFYQWYHAPVETHAMVIAVLQEMAQKDGIEKWQPYIEQLQHWLIGNKQSNHWSSTRSTADACFALVNGNKNLTTASPEIRIQLGGLVLEPGAQEVGTGYFKRVIAADQIKPEMGKVKITITNTDKAVSSPSYGGLYLQYLDDIDKVTGSDANNKGLRISKQLFMERNTEQGKKLYLVTDKDGLQVGNKLVVRLTLTSDRDMDYVHLQDMRGAGVEPDNVLGTYKWQDGLGYYETTKDVTTDFFFNHLSQGTFVFDYPVHVTHTGHFSAGTATLECMYAPEFAAHSQGFTIDVKK